MARLNTLILATAALLSAMVSAQSASSQAFHCPANDGFNSPLCTSDNTATSTFTCYYSENLDSTGCSQSSQYYCTYSKTAGTLTACKDVDGNTGNCVCANSGASGPPTRLIKARSASPAPPQAAGVPLGHMSRRTHPVQVVSPNGQRYSKRAVVEPLTERGQKRAARLEAKKRFAAPAEN
ncbi:hypothetical protein T439DRAFT_325330 [Meredithblackwellia eburnea MCA 4105]